MKTTQTIACLMLLTGLAACGTDTVVHERPVIVAPGAATVPLASPTPDSVEAICKNGYDNRKRSCY